MNKQTLPTNKKASVIVFALVIIMIMTSMGIGLYYSSKQAAMQIASSTNKTQLLYAAESCITESIQKIKTASNLAPPCTKQNPALCQKPIYGGLDKLNKYFDFKETKAQRQQLKNYTYECRISLLGTDRLAIDAGVGSDVGSDITYNNMKKTKYLYKIKAQADGQGRAKSTIEVVTSIIY